MATQKTNHRTTAISLKNQIITLDAKEKAVSKKKKELREKLKAAQKQLADSMIAELGIAPEMVIKVIPKHGNAYLFVIGSISHSANYWNDEDPTKIRIRLQGYKASKVKKAKDGEEFIETRSGHFVDVEDVRIEKVS